MSNDISEYTQAIHKGDCRDVLADLPRDSVHSVVTDPPYGLAFMGRDWDDFDPREYQQWCEQWAREAKRVLKPGGHLLAFSGNRTHHRLFSGVEDAGFAVRDTITWHYGSGFPKALDVSKAIDKQADAEREVVGEKTAPDGVPLKDRVSHSGEEYDESSPDYDDCKRDVYEREPATPEAEQWDGFKTALKPSTEYVVVARKPLSEGTVAENVIQHGTGALNVDGCRVDTDETLSYGSREIGDGEKYHTQPEPDDGGEQHKEGRYPSNVVFHEDEAERLDEQVGALAGAGYETGGEFDSGEANTYNLNNQKSDGYTDNGGPSRYFYTSKASKAERTEDGQIKNAHPTVKPVDLMEWLVTLTTAEDQIVLDPFAGTGTTCKAAKQKGRRFIGIEQQANWCDVARVRCGLTPEDPSVVRSDTNQRGLEAYANTDQ